MAYEFDRAELQWLAAHGTPLAIEAGDVLFREGDAGDALYVVLDGALRIFSGHTLYETVRPGGIVGEMAIINEGYPRSASVSAATRSQLLRLDGPALLALIGANPSFALTLMRVSSRRLRAMNRRYFRRRQHPPATEPALSPAEV